VPLDPVLYLMWRA